MINFEELKTKTVDKKRFYVTPEGNEYPSITTVLSPRGKEGLMKWRKRVVKRLQITYVIRLQPEEQKFIKCVKIF